MYLFKRKGTRRIKDSFRLDGEEIRVISEYRYLGCMIRETQQDRGMIEARENEGYTAMGA